MLLGRDGNMLELTRTLGRKTLWLSSTSVNNFKKAVLKLKVDSWRFLSGNKKNQKWHLLKAGWHYLSETLLVRSDDVWQLEPKALHTHLLNANKTPDAILLQCKDLIQDKFYGIAHVKRSFNLNHRIFCMYFELDRLI